ncbi:MAG: hypothetical protein P4L84_34720 [Isosphaeraceae bacterium]|nr:hypothetical protein [Isosphaeraceae bacterium]
MDASPSVADAIADLLRALGARAAGLWWVDGGCLAQAAFVACAEMPADVAREFAAATLSVPLTERSLGIVAAGTMGATVVSRVVELEAASGSGRWLRAFGAERSVAVPLVGENGCVVGVLSVALPASPESDETVAGRLCEAGRSLRP